LQASFSSSGARITVVDELDPVPDEDVVLDANTFADKGVTRNLAELAHTGIFLDFYECADLRVVADLAPVQIYKLREPDVFPQFHVL
jgi:hypothetical protein